ncbi:MAG: rhomboid family intramembrane serine protease [Chitinophagales bacterium]|nr:rhomboid family intramembrane serine protease [Bacteroidota bacterium]MCB9043414.1 rhomboid family intramembrane serine protease [Chitinophagales bacterium]
MSITLLIVVLTAITSIAAFNNPPFREQLLHIPYLVSTRKEYYRLLSSGFIHANWMHLIVNMWVLYMFGTQVEYTYKSLFGVWGNLYYVGLYLLGLLASSLPVQWKEQNNVAYRALGASGAVSAVVFAAILFSPTSNLYLFPFPFPIPAFIFGALYIFYEYYSARQNRYDGIGHDAHFYGAVFGFLFTLALEPSLFPYFIEQIRGYIGF